MESLWELSPLDADHWLPKHPDVGACPWTTPAAKRAEALALRRERRWGAAHIAHEVGLAASTTQKILAVPGWAALTSETGPASWSTGTGRNWPRSVDSRTVRIASRSPCALPGHPTESRAPDQVRGALARAG